MPLIKGEGRHVTTGALTCVSLFILK